MLCCFNLDCTHFARVTLHIRFPMEPSSRASVVVNLGPIALAVGDFAGALIDFLIIALVIFVIMKQLQKTGLK